ncbi:SpoIIE family protein phosphatase [Streptomyces sp. TRM 70351]|uniref:SpoIIE family protein phosphatase n=1 Tax=Streptomyces sp. TRM 70351 TaxID=3116552 RepID=UPI002E7C2120|nr:SpoIIE family protein phosphatase [Streptomyces sp. TRM 70351]MEE1927952.1 SpoIIE family protein phosphatase [Streptomyces sp. TRM 70351]
MNPHPAGPHTTSVRIDHESAVALAAATARKLARRCDLPGALPEQAAVIASELASNLHKHAVDGVLYVQPLPLGGGLEIMAADRGPGMPEPARCLTDGFSTTGSLGAGLGGVNRIATSFTLRTQAGTGTLACARITLPGEDQAARQEVGVVCLPAVGEQHSGDACAVADTGSVRTAIVVDGLGHGPQASEAAQTAVRAFHRDPGQPLPDVLTIVHRALRHSRGAAVGLLRLTAGRSVAEYCGVGNVRALTVSAHEVHRRLTGRAGVVGLSLPPLSTHVVPLPPGTTCVLHSDGVDARWARSPGLFVLRLPPPLLATALVHRHRITRDDATVLTARPPQRLP